MKKTNNHICIISPSLKMGGIERALVVLANYYAGEGYRVTFISCLPGKRFYTLLPEVEVIEAGFGHKGGVLSGITFYPRLIAFIRKQVKHLRPDAVLAFGDWFSPMVLLALYGTKYPIYISDRTSPDYAFKFPIPQLKKWLYPRSAGFIAQTQRAADYRRRQFGDNLNIRVIPNAIREVQLYPEMAREKIILYVGRFAWEKAPDRLIRAFAAIENRQGWQLHMAGSGPLFEPMKQLAEKLNISNEVVFHGSVEQVDPLYARAGIYVLPSVLEGFPNSLCEAMAAGLPAICFDSIPHESILSHNIDGIVVPNGDLNKLSEALKLLMDNPGQRKELGAKAVEIRQRLSVEKVGQQVLHFMNS